MVGLASEMVHQPLLLRFGRKGTDKKGQALGDRGTSSAECGLPAHDEAGNVAPLVRELRHVLADRPYEIVLIDDGSTDDTLTEMNALAKEAGDVIVLRHHHRLGKQVALVAGFERASHEWRLTLDADGQDDPRFVEDLLQTQRMQKADAVVGVRRRSEPFFRAWLQRLFAWLVALRFSVCLRDVNSPCRLFRACLVKDHVWRQGEFRFLPALWAMRGAKVVETSVEQRPRERGRSKFLGPWRYIEALFILWTLPAAPSSPARKRVRVGIQSALSIGLLAFLAFFQNGTNCWRPWSIPRFPPC